MSEAEEKFATMGQVKALVRRKLRKIPPHEEQSLNIYPMMDMMTILLVFLIMNFATQAATIVQSAELQIPVSTSQRVIEQSVIVTISTNSVVVEGHPILSLRNGLIDPSQKQGGANGFLVTPMLTEMQRQRDRLKQLAALSPRHPFNGDLEIIADKRTPFRTLIELIYTCGQAEFKNLRFVVRQTGQAHQHGIGTHS